MWDISLFTFDSAFDGTSKYIWAGTMLKGVIWATSEAEVMVNVLYDNRGESIGMKLDLGSAAGMVPFYLLYEKNLQGDVTALVNAFDGSLFGDEMGYDAFGGLISEMEFDNGNFLGSLLSAIVSVLNPFHYRSYLLDVASELYFLQTRFLNPEWGRFMNADSLVDTGTGILGTNMFAYCDNNPVNKIDPTGMWGSKIHEGYDILKGTAYQYYSKNNDSKYDGTYYGTYAWANDLGLSSKNLTPVTLAQMFTDFPNTAAFPAAFAFLTFYIIDPKCLPLSYNLSYHMDENYGIKMIWDENDAKGVVWPDSRDIRALQILVRLEQEQKYFSDAQKSYEKSGLWNYLTANLEHFNGLYQLGLALHPLQDKHGHNNYYQEQRKDLCSAITAGIEEDSAGSVFYLFLYESSNGEKRKMKYEHFDDIIRTRDETYNVLGRFYKGYNDVFARW